MEHNAGLSGAEKRRGRRIFNAFAVVNSFSFLLLSGNMITLFALRLGASSAMIGVLASFPYVAFFFMVLGKRLVRRFGVVKLFGHAWLVRYVLMLPAVAIPAVAALVNPGAALGLLVVCTLGFHAARGVGMIGESPTMAALSAGRDRGEYVSRFQITVAAVSIVTGLAIAALLGARAPLTRYALFVWGRNCGGLCFGGAGVQAAGTGCNARRRRAAVVRDHRRVTCAPQLCALYRRFRVLRCAHRYGPQLSNRVR